MKNLLKIATLFVLLTLAMNPAQAQDMQKGTKLVQAGIGLGGWGTYNSQTPILSASYMQGINDDFLDGKLAVGGSIGYKSARYESFYGYDWTWTYTFISGRATWYPNFIQSEKIDAYAGLGLGLLMVRFDAQGDQYAVDNGGSTAVITGIVGARYTINENWGAYAEIGNNLGYLTLGVSYSL